MSKSIFFTTVLFGCFLSTFFSFHASAEAQYEAKCKGTYVAYENGESENNPMLIALTLRPTITNTLSQPRPWIDGYDAHYKGTVSVSEFLRSTGRWQEHSNDSITATRHVTWWNSYNGTPDSSSYSSKLLISNGKSGGSEIDLKTNGPGYHTLLDFDDTRLTLTLTYRGANFPVFCRFRQNF